MSRVVTSLPDFKTVFAGHFQAVFSEKGDEFVINIRADILENMGNNRVSDFEFGRGIEVDFINGAAGSENEHEDESWRIDVPCLS